MNYDSMYNELNKKSSNVQKFWLFYAESSKGMSLTKGNINDFKDYSALIAYSEEFNVINTQFQGVKGLCASNVLVTLPKDQNSLNLYSKFSSGSILNLIKIVQIVVSNNANSIQQELSFNTCKIESFKSYMDKVILVIKYNSRKEDFVAYNSDGSKMGHCVG